MSERHFVIMGLPGSGKTTFLAALWHLIEAGEITPELILDRLEGDARYLTELAAAWREFLPLPRTGMQNEPTITMHVRGTHTGTTAALTFPDLSGESYDVQIEGRRCRETYVERWEHDGGGLLFITADRPHDDRTIVEQNHMLGPIEEEASDNSTGSDVPPPSTWSPKDVPQQIRLFELLQFLTMRPFRRRRRRLAVMISAWDLIPDPRPTPDGWLAAEMPLVHQYLRANGSWFEVQVYGLSAQGIALNASAPELDDMARRQASRRISLVGPNAGQHDLTAPLTWLMASR